MCTGLPVSSAHPCPPDQGTTGGAGTRGGVGVVGDRPAAGAGGFDGIVDEFGNVASDQLPKWSSCATKRPSTGLPSVKSAHSPPADVISTSTNGAVLSSWTVY